MENLDNILDNLIWCSPDTTDKFQQQKYNFWNSLSKEQVTRISDIVLQKPGTNLNELDNYSLKELKYIFDLFPFEKINKQVKKSIDMLAKFNICKLLDYRVYNTNVILIKNIKTYIKSRKKKKD